MQDSAKYLIHATVEADGVVERSDVVGAVFGQTEGLLGAEMDLRGLQDASKVGRIDVEVESEGGRSKGELTIASNLDKVETAVLAASLETIRRVGPCRAEVSVSRIEDVRAAKRRQLVERAKELVTESFDESVPSTEELLNEVRQAVRVDDVTNYDGFPAGPRVEESDAIIVVEGRSDVVQLLRYGVKNAVAVEGTDIPDQIAKLSTERTVTAFFDGDRGGELILEELAQVGNVDFVAVAPDGRSVEDLDRSEVLAALRQKVPFDEYITHPIEQSSEASSANGMERLKTAESGTRVGDSSSSRPAPAIDQGGSLDEANEEPSPESTVDTTEPPTPPTEAPPPSDTTGATTSTDTEPARERETPAGDSPPDSKGNRSAGSQPANARSRSSDEDETPAQNAGQANEQPAETDPDPPPSIRTHVEEVIGTSTGSVRLLNVENELITEGSIETAVELTESAEPVPTTIILDGTLTQRILDVAAQQGVDQVIATDYGDFVKRPTDVRLGTVEEILAT